LDNELEQMVCERDQLRERLAMAGPVCHELNQPLQLIMSYAELLLMQIPEGEGMRDDARMIYEQTEKMKDISERLERLVKGEE
jgi:nitrogen-specific signal transduction histidine kinase